MRKPKQSQVWTVRNKSGQYIGSYRAFTAEQAIGKVIAEQASISSTFKRSQPMMVKTNDFTAKVEVNG